METLELDVWKNGWGLPSIDTECLQVLVYAKFNNIPLKVNTSSNPFRTPHGRLPVLRCSTGTIDTVKDIISYFRTKNYNSEFGLTREQHVLVMAYESMFKEKLFPALQFIWWLDKQNVETLIRPWYCKALPFPLKFYYPGKFEREARTMFEALYPTEDNMAVVENQVYSDAQKFLTLLSTRLGDSDYFFEQGPCILDAIIYSYLAPLLKVQFPNPALQNHLKACINLEKFVSRISQQYFKDESDTYEHHKAEENAQKIRRDSETEFPNKTRNQLLAALFATCAMTGYALSTGIVEVPASKNDALDEAVEYMLEDEDTETE